MSKTVRIDLARDFSRFPFGRSEKHSPHNGEKFRNEWLLPPLRAGDRVEVVLDGARGLGPSFLEEAFGGLVRAGIAIGVLRANLTIISERDPSRKVEIDRYINEEALRGRTT